MGGADRIRLVAVLALVAVVIVLVVVASSSGDGAEQAESRRALRIERSAERPELLLYIEEEAANSAERADGRARVTVECLDADGLVLASQEEPWPMTDTDGNTLAPHAHVPVNPARFADVASCRIAGTDPLLEASLR